MSNTDLPPPIDPAAPGDATLAWARNAQRIARLVLAVALAGLGIWILWGFLAPLTWAGIFAIGTWPLYLRFLGRLPRNFERRTLAPLAFTLLVGLIFLVPLGLIAAELGRELFVLLRLLQQVERDGMPVPDQLQHLPVVGAYITEWWQANLSDPRMAGRLLGRVGQGDLVSWTRMVGAQLLHRTTDLVFTLLTLFFLYRDGPRLLVEFDRLNRRLFGSSRSAIGISIVNAVRGTVNGLVLVGLAEGAVLGIAYWVLGLKNAVLLGTLTAIVASIPFGAFVVFTAASLLLLAQSQMGAAIGLFIFGLFVLVLADHFVRPILIGGAARLPFLWVLLGIIGGLEAVGLLGLFIGPAVLAAVLVVWREMTIEPAAPKLE